MKETYYLFFLPAMFEAQKVILWSFKIEPRAPGNPPPTGWEPQLCANERLKLSSKLPRHSTKPSHRKCYNAQMQLFAENKKAKHFPPERQSVFPPTGTYMSWARFNPGSPALHGALRAYSAVWLYYALSCSHVPRELPLWCGCSEQWHASQWGCLPNNFPFLEQCEIYQWLLT